MADPQKRALPEQKSWLPLILVLLVLAGTLGFVVWKFALGPKEPAVSFTAPPPATPNTSSDYAPPPAYPESTFSPGRPAPSISTSPTAESLPVRPDNCTLIAEEIRSFFSRLQGRPYLQQRQPIPDVAAHLAALSDRLLTNPPVVTGETASLFAVLNNTAHFYRLLSANDLLLFKDILDQEGSELEIIFDLFHRWSRLAPECSDSGINLNLPLPATYEYAGFFLNTLGGRSYLFRRESRVRMLIKYYSILTLDQANEAKLNRHGLDIRPAINGLLGEMAGATTLNRRDEYLATLTELQDKYQQQYGK